MKPNIVKEKIDTGGVALGSFFLEFATDGIGRIAAGAGADFAIFDMEHTGWSLETVRRLIATSQSTDIVPIVRVPATEYHFVARALDVGAMGVMAPMVETAEQAERLVRYAKYPPVGGRGAVFGVAHDNYTGGSIREKTEHANGNTLVVAQIETPKGLENAASIAEVEGVDVLFVGPADLTCTLGVPGQFDDPRIRDAEAKVVEVCQQHGKTAGHLPARPAIAFDQLDRGFRFLAYGADLWLYQSALRNGLREIREYSGR